MTERKPCAGCPWVFDSTNQWREHIISTLHRLPRPHHNSQPIDPPAPVQGCHKLTEQQVPLAETQHACVGHLNHRLKEAQQNNDEELIQELSLLYAELNG